MYINDLARMAKDSIIKLNLGERYINDFYHAKINYYEINIRNFVQDVIVIKANKQHNSITAITPSDNSFLLFL